MTTWRGGIATCPHEINSDGTRCFRCHAKPVVLAPAEVRDAIWQDILQERSAQDEQWGDQSHHPDLTWFAILSEEVGECAQSILHDQFGGKAAGTLRAELVQAVTVGVAWLEAIDRRLMGGRS